MKAFWIPDQPPDPRVVAVAQYSHVIRVSPPVGLRGAPHEAHFRSFEPAGATTWGAAGGWGGVPGGGPGRRPGRGGRGLRHDALLATTEVEEHGAIGDLLSALLAEHGDPSGEVWR